MCKKEHKNDLKNNNHHRSFLNCRGLNEATMCDLFEGLRENENLVRLSVANCDVNDFAVSTLALALERNMSLKSLNLESNRISPDTLASLFEALANNANGIVEVHATNQAQTHMG